METTRSEIRSQPPAKRVNCTNCAEQCLNALHRWEWTQVPTGLHKAPLPYALFHHGYATMNKTLGHVRPGTEDDWCVSSLGPMPFPCSEIYVPTVEAQRDFTGTPLRVLGAKASGGKHLPSSLTHTYTQILIPTYVCWALHLRHRHICRHIHKSLVQNGCNLAPGEPAHCLWPPLSLPSGSSRASC